MKINNVLKQTALAAAIAAVSFGAAAGELTVTTPAVVANEIFGEGSETTSIRLPLVKFKADGALIGKNAADATVKLTLAGQPIFAENYQDPNSWADQGIVVTVGGNVLAPADIVDVVGGTANDNQITIKLASSVTGTIDDVTLEGYKVKRLKDALERDLDEPVRSSKVTLEVRSGGDFENTKVVPAFVSINGLAVASTSTANNRQMIQVGAGQKQFTTSTGTAAAKDFTTATKLLDLGTLKLSRGVVPAGQPGEGQEAGKETGEIFDFTGGDKIKLTLNSNSKLAPYGALTLQTGACNVASAGVVGTFSATGDATSATIEVPTSSVNLDASTPWNLCATADGEQVIPQAKFDASVAATYLNVRYTESKDTADYGQVLRNGCQVSLFNLPNVNAADNAFIRFTNTSDVDVAGEVTATIWGQDGEKVLENELVLGALKPHATAVLHTSQTQGSDAASNVVYLGEALPAFAETGGRSRIVLNGAFPSCEALGLVRSANGTLVNMTSTVYSGGENNTSNTTN